MSSLLDLRALGTNLKEKLSRKMANTLEVCTPELLKALENHLQHIKAEELGVPLEQIQIQHHNAGFGPGSRAWLSWRIEPDNPLLAVTDERYRPNYVGGDMKPLKDRLWFTTSYGCA